MFESLKLESCNLVYMIYIFCQLAQSLATTKQLLNFFPKCLNFFLGEEVSTKTKSVSLVYFIKENKQAISSKWNLLIVIIVNWVGVPMHGSTSLPPSPVSQPTFKFKRFGFQFQVQNFCCSFFFSVADFFSRTKFFYRYRCYTVGAA